MSPDYLPLITNDFFNNQQIPLVIRKHSKSFAKHNQKNLEKFLMCVKDNPSRFRIIQFSDFDLTKTRRICVESHDISI